VLTRNRFFLAAGFVLVGAGLTWAAAPQYIKLLLLVTVMILVALWVAYLVLSDRTLPFLGSNRSGRLAGRGVATLGWTGIGLTVLLLVPQHVSSPTSPLPDYNLPSAVSEYQDQLQSAEGDVIIVGGVPDVNDPDAWDELLVGNLWYVAEEDVQNAYSAVYYSPYNNLTCMSYNGSTCPDLYDRLFEPMEDTGLIGADLMGISSVLSVKGVVQRRDWNDVPEGWSIVEDSDQTRLIVRDEPVAGAGSVVWSSEGTEVSVLSEDAMGVTFQVDAVGADGGQVAMSRIPWPGYQADGATVSADPVDTFLLGVDIDADQVGETVTVSFYAPGYQLQLAAAALILLIMLGWPLLRLIGRRRGDGGNAVGRLAAGSRRPAPEGSV
jgi:hypothetical protein